MGMLAALLIEECFSFNSTLDTEQFYPFSQQGALNR